MLENIVFLELLRRGKNVFFFKQDKECDFIIKEQNDIVGAIQVTQSLSNPETRQREIAGLLGALSAFNLREGIIWAPFKF